MVALRAGHWAVLMAVQMDGHWVALRADSRADQRALHWESSLVVLRAVQRADQRGIHWESSLVALRAVQRGGCLAGPKAGKMADLKAGKKVQQKCSAFRLVAMWASLKQRDSSKVAHLACQTWKDS